jgi:hypothetical protein
MSHPAPLVSSLALVALVAVPGCSWVPLTDAGAEVRLVDAVTARDCTRVGGVTANTRDRVAGLSRVEEKQAEELQALARNEAARLGANAVVPVSDIEEGSQQFDALVCELP